MRDFIQYKLRTLLEVATNRDSDLNIPKIIRYGNSHIYTLDGFKNMIKVAKELAENIPKEQLEQLSVDYGNGGYEYMLSQTRDGNFIFRGKETTNYFEPGSYKESQGGKTLFFYTKACSSYSDDMNECNIIYNPSVDAKIKILNDEVLSGVIERFIGDSLGYLDDKGEEIQKSKMTPDEILKLANKEEKNKQKSMKKKGYFGSELDLISQKSILNKRVAELRSKSIITKLGPEEREELIDLKSEIKLIDKQLKEKETQMNKIRSGSKNI